LQNAAKQIIKIYNWKHGYKTKKRTLDQGSRLLAGLSNKARWSQGGVERLLGVYHTVEELNFNRFGCHILPNTLICH
jgi:hypothetical protein